MVVTQADRNATTSAFLEYLHGPERPVLVFDGATGTSLQGLGLTADDFGGPDLEGCNAVSYTHLTLPTIYSV